MAEVMPIDPVAAPPGRPPAAPERRRTADGAYCIRLATYIPDVRRTIEAVGPRKRARRELLRPPALGGEPVRGRGGQPGRRPGHRAVHAGDRPATRSRRRFQPGRGALASARYLSELARDYGNIGLAAAAYNGGEARVARFIAAKGGLPAETRAYVHAITGHSVECGATRRPRRSTCRWRRRPRSRPPASPMPPAAACARSATAPGAAVGRRRRLEPRAGRRRAPGRPPAEPLRRDGRRAGELHPRPDARDAALAQLRADRPQQPRRGRGALRRARAVGGDCMVQRN